MSLRLFIKDQELIRLVVVPLVFKVVVANCSLDLFHFFISAFIQFGCLQALSDRGHLPTVQEDFSNLPPLRLPHALELPPVWRSDWLLFQSRIVWPLRHPGVLRVIKPVVCGRLCLSCYRPFMHGGWNKNDMSQWLTRLQ